jgi:predicted dehydrogenase
MKFLIAGLGSIGRRHLHNLLALGERDICLYRTRQSTLPDSELEGFLVDTSLEAALDRRPDAVIVANPTALHLDTAIPAARAGCHLLLEKPISHSMDRIPDLQAAVQEGGRQVLVGFQLRFHPGLQAADRLLQSGAVGRPVSIRAHWGEYLPGWHPWEDYRAGYSARPELGGGVVLTLSHPLDYLGWLFGGVRSLWAFTGALGDLGLQVEDTAEIGLQFSNGILGSVHLDYNQRPPVHSLEVIGTHGTLRWDNASGAVRLYNAVQSSWQDYPPPGGFERNDLFLAEMRHFIQVVRGEEAPLCSLEAGIQAQRLALAALHSAQSGQRVEL